VVIMALLSQEAQVVMVAHLSKEAQLVIVGHLRKHMALCLLKIGQQQEIMFHLEVHQNNNDHLQFQEILQSKGGKE
jgi:hypothetical protein